ncbi:hypothetical protein QBC36DRAFT_328689 [Triangularia setosa]|uniref:Uncharacterized protein n=1 Tax=Triangularia setosa TaxID=2587417 RepID=A0AAN6WAT0_9PEZI|nr:hypothetical protein QBC36DRAFT_328689 [Podospora setosa]
MWTTNRRDDSATPPLPPHPHPRPSTSLSSYPASSPSPVQPLSPSCSEQQQPVYHMYPPDSRRHHHQLVEQNEQNEYCHATGTRRGCSSPPPVSGQQWGSSMVDLPYVDYTQVEIQSQSIKVIRSPLSLVRSVASRLPTSPYMLARAVSTYATRSRGSSPPAETPAVVATTPPLPSRSRIEEGGYSSNVLRERQVSSMTARRERERAGEGESGVNWDYGSQGIGMLYHARQGGSTPDLERMNYINSLAYLLRGLPVNLTPAEASTIRQTTPAAVLGGLRQQQGGDYSGHYRESPMQPPTGRKNFVHHAALILLNWLSILLHWVVPLVRQAIFELAQFEKDHQYFSKMAMSTWAGTKNAYVWFSSAYAGQVVAAGMGYFLQGVQGALSEFSRHPVPVPVPARSGGGHQNGLRPEDRERRQYGQQHGWPPQQFPRDFGQFQGQL